MIRHLRKAALLFLALGSTALAQAPKWQSITPTGMTTEDFVESIAFPTPTHGYAGVWRFTTNNSTFHVTTDGGAHWASRTLTGTVISDMVFTDETHGAIAATQNDGTTGAILLTSDGGQSWGAPIPLPGRPGALFFLDASTGYVVGSDAMLMKTVNGGSQWSPIAVPGTSGYSFGSIFFVDANTGYLMAAAPQEFATKLYKTTDGGANWTKVQDFGSGAATGDGKGVNDLWFVDANVGFAAGRSGSPAIFKTTDGGAHWTTQYQSASPANLNSVQKIAFADASIGYAVSDEGVVLRTVNGGTSWTPEYSGPSGSAFGALSVIDQTTAIAGGANGSVIKRLLDAPKPSAVVSTQSVNFGRVQLGGNKELSFTVSAENSAGLRIDSIYIDAEDNPGAASFAIVTPAGGYPRTLALGEPLTVTVRFTPQPGGDSILLASLAIVTNSPEAPNSYVSLNGRVDAGTQPQPAAVLTTSQLDFGTVQLSQTRDQSLTIASGTSAPLMVTSLGIEDKTGTDNGFTIVAPAGPFPISVAQGSPLVITVRLAPKRAEAVASDLVIGTNDPANALLRVHMLGEGKTSTSAVALEDAVAGASVTVMPNPIGAEGHLSITLPAPSDASVTIADLNGHIVSRAFQGTLDAGTHLLPLDVGALADGTYACLVRTGRSLVVRKLVILR